MISVTLNRNVRRFFFDKTIVLKAADQGRVKALSRIGSFIMTGARRSIRKRKRSSDPGSPPSSHTDDLRKGPGSIVFAYDPAKKSVVVGPRPLNKVFVRGGKPRSGTVPEVLEVGGSIGVIEQSWDGRDWFRIDLRRSRRTDTRKRIRFIRILARPYMKPSFDRERQNDRLKAAWSRVIN